MRKLIFISFVMIFFLGCESNQLPGYDPVAGEVYLAAPNLMLNSESLVAAIGLIDSQPFNRDGTAHVTLNRAVPQLVRAVAMDGTLYLMGIAIPSEQGTNVELSTRSTAIALVFLTPAVVQTDPYTAAALLRGLATEPAIANLASMIGASISMKGQFLPDPVDTELATAIHDGAVIALKLLEQIPGTGTAASALTVSPGSEQSGINVTVSGQDTGTATVTINNSKKRYLASYLESEGIVVASAMVSSRRPLLDFSPTKWNPLGPGKKELGPYQPTKYPNAELTTYGMSLKDGASNTILSNQHRSRWILPAISTLYFDFFAPLADVCIGIGNVLTTDSTDSLLNPYAPRRAVEKLLETVAYDVAVQNEADKFFNSGDLAPLFAATIVRTIETILNLDNGILTDVLLSAGLGQISNMVVNKIAEIGTPFGQVLFIAKSVNGLFESGSAVFDWMNVNPLESFSITADASKLCGWTCDPSCDASEHCIFLSDPHPVCQNLCGTGTSSGCSPNQELYFLSRGNGSTQAVACGDNYSSIICSFRCGRYPTKNQIDTLRNCLHCENPCVGSAAEKCATACAKSGDICEFVQWQQTSFATLNGSCL